MGGKISADKQRILIVENEADFAELLAYSLTRDGYEVITAPDGETGIERVGAEQPDLVLLDLNLPGLDGLAVCELMRRQRRTERIPVIMMTGWSSPNARAIGEHLGASDYLTKPFSLRDLKQSIANVFAPAA